MLNPTVINEVVKAYDRVSALGMSMEDVIRYHKAIAEGWVVVMHDRDDGVDYLVLWPDTRLCSALMSFGVVEV